MVRDEIFVVENETYYASSTSFTDFHRQGQSQSEFAVAKSNSSIDTRLAPQDIDGRNIFGGGFLGLDNIGLFDRSKPLADGRQLEQADGTAWMAFYAVVMLDMAIELSFADSTYEDMASKFFEHFVRIVDSMNALGRGGGLWDETDGFYYDYIRSGPRSDKNTTATPMRIRSMVGLIPLFAVLVLDEHLLDKLPAFTRRTNWFMENRKDLAQQVYRCVAILAIYCFC